MKRLLARFATAQDSKLLEGKRQLPVIENLHEVQLYLRYYAAEGDAVPGADSKPLRKTRSQGEKHPESGACPRSPGAGPGAG